MDLTVERVEVWATTIDDKPGRLAKTLTGLREAGADLHFILARRAPEAPGQAVVFVTPLYGDAELEAASIAACRGQRFRRVPKRKASTDSPPPG